MVTRRTAKNKGAQFEYDCQYSLKDTYTDIYRTSERGFQLQYDLRSDKGEAVFECKRLKGLSWNQAVKYFKKLQDKSPKDYKCYLLFKSNQQPCLVMHQDDCTDSIYVVRFDSLFGEFKKHPSTRGNKDDNKK